MEPKIYEIPDEACGDSEEDDVSTLLNNSEKFRKIFEEKKLESETKDQGKSVKDGETEPEKYEKKCEIPEIPLANESSSTPNDKDAVEKGHDDDKDDVIDLEKEEVVQKFSIEEADEFKRLGNVSFGTQKFEEAVGLYTEALEVAPVDHPSRSIYLANRAACYQKLGKDDEVIDDCTKALEINGDYVKAILRRASSYENQKKYKEALTDYQKGRLLSPDNNVCIVKCMELPSKVKQQEEEMKEEMLGKLKSLGNSFLGNFGMSLDNFQTQQQPDGSYSVNFNQS